MIQAANAEVAAVFLRRPSDWFHVVRWNMTDDSFEPGAWLKGRIYPEKCDLSPNGKLLLYAALQMRKWRTAPEYESYTAISRLPWLAALLLWPEDGTWSGGGRFVSNSEVVLHSSGRKLHPAHADPAITFTFGHAGYHRSGNEVDDCDWCGRDRQGRLIFAREGQLFRQSKSGVQTIVADFRNVSPNPGPSPEAARGPLQRGGKPSDI